MRRLLCVPVLVRVLVVPLLALFLLLAGGAAVASTAGTAPSVVTLAAEEGGEIEAPEPKGPNEEGNEFAPVEYEPNFLWGAAIGLFALTAIAFLAVGGLYWLLVKRPRESRQRT